ncbi:alpha/beta hydrolase [Nonomuraea endophytica]|uniref:Acetyl esterase/lipase n=1 Tax=Nonomuraea endophytica TaxID=714136 RepID=A0A7W8EK85_9ACTN|nr:alpha/beta hydrolase [Nonomuraea endophytica]MBB5081477.1 acetyl esterase/lipase [Nonomuraea endophytica]
MSKPVLESAAQAFADATANPPYLFQLPVEDGRKAVDEAQTPEIDVPGTTRETAGNLTIFRPADAAGPLPVILYIHGAGWVFGNDHTHGRLARELALGVGAAVVFVNYDRAPEAPYPAAIHQNLAAARWVVQHGATFGLDPSRMAVAGDSVGGNMSAALTLQVKGEIPLRAQVLFYPVTDASFDTDSYHQFTTGYFLRRDGMQWFWDQYTTDPAQRAEITASPLRATTADLAGLPPALVITAEADVLRDEGEAYADKLREAGVPVIAVRYQGIIHDFVMLNALRATHAAQAAITQAITFLKGALS